MLMKSMTKQKLADKAGVSLNTLNEALHRPVKHFYSLYAAIARLTPPHSSPPPLRNFLPLQCKNLKIKKCNNSLFTNHYSLITIH